MNIKNSRADRRHRTEISCAKQLRIAKQKNMHNTSSVQQPHRMAKRHAMDCGRPKCMLCGNRRKVFGEITFQEQKNTQDKFYQDDQLEDESNKD